MANIYREDFLLDEDGDFPLEDLVIDGVYLPTPYGPSDNRHMEDVTLCNIGWNKQFPTEGFGVSRYLNAEVELQKIFRELKIEMLKDKYDTQIGAVEIKQKRGFEIYFRYIKPVY